MVSHGAETRAHSGKPPATALSGACTQARPFVFVPVIYSCQWFSACSALFASVRRDVKKHMLPAHSTASGCFASVPVRQRASAVQQDVLRFLQRPGDGGADHRHEHDGETAGTGIWGFRSGEASVSSRGAGKGKTQALLYIPSYHLPERVVVDPSSSLEVRSVFGTFHPDDERFLSLSYDSSWFLSSLLAEAYRVSNDQYDGKDWFHVVAAVLFYAVPDPHSIERRQHVPSSALFESCSGCPKLLQVMIQSSLKLALKLAPWHTLLHGNVVVFLKSHLGHRISSG